MREKRNDFGDVVDTMVLLPENGRTDRSGVRLPNYGIKQ